MRSSAFILCLMIISTFLKAEDSKLKAYRASFFHVLNAPKTEAGKYTPAKSEFIKDGLMVIEKGLIKEMGSYTELSAKYKGKIEITDYSGKIITPGFIDTHIHFPQTEMLAAHGEQLLDWLDKYTFPTEKKFKEEAYARKVSKVFLDELLRNGTTTALVFGTMHPESVNAFFKEAQARKLRMIAGKVMMDHPEIAPDGLRDDVDSSFSDSEELIKKWHGTDRLLYAITPRFAPTSTPEQLLAAAKLKELYPEVYIHTHVAENKGEVAWVKELYPKSKTYLGVYHDHGLVKKKAVFAHGIYLEDSDYKLLQKNEQAGAGSAISFCPTSNLFLGSGLFPLQKAEAHNIRVGLGTDVGAGTSFSMLQTMNEAYKVVQLQKAFTTDDPKTIRPLSADNAFYLATLGSARALYLDDKLGNFKPGKEADFIVLNPEATPLTKFRMSYAKKSSEMLFAMMLLGDDRMVQETYIAGEKWAK